MKASQSPQPSTRMDLLKFLLLSALICTCVSHPQRYEAPTTGVSGGYSQTQTGGGGGGFQQTSGIGGGYGQSQGGSGGGYRQTSGGMPYNFQWEVNDPDSGNQYSHQQSSDGSITQGQYRVLLPDGRIQTVVFVDNGNGFEPEVTYEGEARYPQTSGGRGGYGQGATGGGFRQGGAAGGFRQGGVTGGYTAPSSGGQTSGGRYSQGGSNQQSGGFSQQSGGFSQQSGGFSQQSGGFSQQSGGFSQQSGGFSQQSGGSGAYNQQSGGTSDGYSQQTGGGNGGYIQQQSGGGGYGQTSVVEPPSTSYEQPQLQGGYQ